MVDPTWDAGGGPEGGFEVAVAQQLVDGMADVALTAGRGWSAAGIDDLVALEAPFLIDDGDLAAAVATSSIADTLLAELATSGVTGLALWPEEMHHVVDFDGCTPPPVLPEAMAGLTVRAVPSVGVDRLLAALGATPVFVNAYGPQVEACEIHSAVSGFHGSVPGFPTFIGDVAPSPRVLVLAANHASMERLTDAQREAVTQAAVTVRDQAIAARQTDAAAAAEWCAGGGAVILAGSEALAAWEAAAAAVVEDLAQDPATAAAIEAIAELKATTPRSPAAKPCGPAPVASTVPSDLTGFSATFPPDGTYRIAPTVEDLIAAGASRQYAGGNAQTWTLTIAGDAWTGEGRTGSQTATCAGTSTPVEGAVRMSTVQDGGCGFDYDIVWREAENGIELRVLAVGGDPDYPDIASERALNERVWVRIDG